MAQRGFFSPVRTRGLIGLFALGGLFSLTGCGGGAEAERYDVSGRVTFNGQPVPSGRIYFDPDFSKQNKGVQGYAEIRDGQFDTSVAGGKGAPGGPVVVRIEGFQKNPGDPDSYGKPLFREFKTQADLPKDSATKEFQVPPTAAKGLFVPPPA